MRGTSCIGMQSENKLILKDANCARSVENKLVLCCRHTFST